VVDDLSSSICSSDGPIHGSGVRPALWYAALVFLEPDAVGDAARRFGDFVRVAIAGRDRASGRLWAVKITSSSGFGCATTRVRERVEQQRMIVKRFDRIETARRRAARPSPHRCTFVRSTSRTAAPSARR